MSTHFRAVVRTWVDDAGHIFCELACGHTLRCLRFSSDTHGDGYVPRHRDCTSCRAMEPQPRFRIRGAA